MVMSQLNNYEHSTFFAIKHQFCHSGLGSKVKILGTEWAIASQSTVLSFYPVTKYIMTYYVIKLQWEQITTLLYPTDCLLAVAVFLLPVLNV